MEIKISEELNSIINYAREEAMRTGSYGIGPDHLYLGILRHHDNAACSTLEKLGTDTDSMKRFIDSRIFTNEHIPYSEMENITFSRASQNILSLSIMEAAKLRCGEAAPQHLLLALCRSTGSYGTTYLRNIGIDYSRILTYMEKNGLLATDSGQSDDGEEISDGGTEAAGKEQETDIISEFGIDLTKAAAEGKLDPVVGRDKEISRVIEILGRRKKNNPMLIGEPGVGKSTMLLQLCGAISNQHTVLYITGEESVRQVKLRAARLKIPQENIYLAAENDVDEICGLIEKEKPDLVVIDSIQTMRCTDISSSSGTVSQVKESAARLLAVAKKQEIPMFIVGHVNKDGAIAGPKVMEHIVDTVLYFEGDKMLPYRILRAAKNRYGSTNELGMFDMTGQGLAEIENPSQMLLEGRPLGVSGNCVACTMEGSRPILSEIQALATKTNFPAPRRASSGYDYNRMNLLIAVLEKRAGYFFGNLDVYINIVGGIALRDTACDLAVCLSMVSSLLDRPVSDKLIAIGEVGLGGEVRSVPNLEQRLREAERIGFERAVIPKHSLAHLNPADYPGMQLVGAAYLSDAIHALKADRL